MFSDIEQSRVSSEAEIVFFRHRIFTYGVQKMDCVVRSSGKSMSSHLASVCALLHDFSAPLEVWVAGVFHDIDEGYLKEESQCTRSSVLLKLNDCLEDLVRSSQEIDISTSDFVEDVNMLIRSVTEPPKSSDENNWRERKQAYLNQISAGDERVALLACATKIDALSDVVSIFDHNGVDQKQFLESWSKGSPAQNVWFFEQLLYILEEKKINDLAIEVYRKLFQQARDKIIKLYAHDIT